MTTDTLDTENWDTQAKGACSLIFRDHTPGGLNELRETLDSSIDDFWLNFALNTRPPVVERWRKIGGIAISMNSDMAAAGTSDPLTVDSVVEVLIKKQRDYGHGNIRRFGREGLLMRCHDKVARLENLYGGDFDPNWESIDDTILDIVGYSTIGIMWENGTFLLPLKSNAEKNSSTVLI